MKKRLKHLQLWLHRHYVQIRNLVIVFVVAMLLIFSMVSVANQNKLISQVKTLTEQNKELSKQNKTLNTQTLKLGEENQAIAKQNRSYSRCIAEIFADYTHDFVPVTILNLDTCTTDSQTQGTRDTTTGGNTPNTGSNSSTSPQQSSSPTTQQVKQNIQPPEEPPEPLLDCTIDLLGFHIGCP